MNTTVLLAAEGERAIEGMQAAKALIDDCEQRFSRFLPASELTELNLSAGEWVPVSTDLMAMLELAQRYYQQSHGIFDPAILPDLKRAGYNRSMDIMRAHGVDDNVTLSSQSAKPFFGHIDIDPVAKRLCLPEGMEIDLGGIAKGWIVKEAAAVLHRYSEVCGVSAGGDILFIHDPLRLGQGPLSQLLFLRLADRLEFTLEGFLDDFLDGRENGVGRLLTKRLGQLPAFTFFRGSGVSALTGSAMWSPTTCGSG